MVHFFIIESKNNLDISPSAMGLFIRNNWMILTLSMNETVSLQLKSNTKNSFVGLEHISNSCGRHKKNFHRSVVDYLDSKA